MSCTDCEGCICCGGLSKEEAAEIVKIAYGPEPDDSVLLTGAQAQRFARRTIEGFLKRPSLLDETVQMDSVTVRKD